MSHVLSPAAVVAGARNLPMRSAMALGTLRRQMLHRAVARRRQLTAPHAPRMASALELVAVLGRQNAEIAQQFQELMRESGAAA